MKKITIKQGDTLCECGHERRDHADDMEDSGKIITEATEFCLILINDFNCKCQEFKLKKTNNQNKL